MRRRPCETGRSPCNGEAETGNEAVVSQGVEQMEFSHAARGSVYWDDHSE